MMRAWQQCVLLRYRLLLGSIVLVSLIACNTAPDQRPTRTISAPTPTMAAMFGQTVPTLTRTESGRLSTPVARIPTVERTQATIVPQPTKRPEDVYSVVAIFTGTLDSHWTLRQSSDVAHALADQHITRDGTPVIAATPEKEGSTLLFAVRAEPAAVYTRAHIVGVSFWLCADQPIPNDALTMAVIGSNQYPYWRKDDTSVHLDGRVTTNEPLFSETRLYYLGINHTIPAHTWVQVINWLDDRTFDPSYQYVTGIAIKNDIDFQQTYYIDHMTLLVQPNT